MKSPMEHVYIDDTFMIGSSFLWHFCCVGSYGSTSEGQYKHSKGAEAAEHSEAVAIKALQGEHVAQGHKD